jgi:hypothetical protein
MTNNSSEPKPVGDLSHRVLKKIGEIDPHLCERNNKKEIDLHSWKKQSSEKWQVYMDSNTGHLRQSKLR